MQTSKSEFGSLVHLHTYYVSFLIFANLFILQAFCESREGRLDSYGKKRRKRDTQRQPRLLDDNINLREMFKVYETRDEISDDYEDEEKEKEAVQPRKSAKRDQFCLSDVEYYGIVTTIVVSTSMLF